MTTDTWTHHRARVASLSRDRAADDPELVEARRSLRAARLEDYARRVVAETDLTAQQRERIIAVLTGGRA